MVLSISRKNGPKSDLPGRGPSSIREVSGNIKGKSSARQGLRSE